MQPIVIVLTGLACNASGSIPAIPPAPPMAPVALLVNVIMLALATLGEEIGWFFNHGRSSLLLAAVFHVTFNMANLIFLPVTAVPPVFAWLIVAEWLLAVPIVRHLAPAPQPVSAPQGI